jgi:hypothetical protein
MSVTDTHEEKETLKVDVNLPGHAPRTTTPLFVHSRKALIKRDQRCYISGATDGEDGPLEAHHYPIERCLAEMIDWELVRQDALAGELGITQAQRDACKAFDWNAFMRATPFDPYTFVDDMRVNGLLLAKRFHTGADEGIHMMPHPLWVAQRYGREGYKFSGIEIIHHDQPGKVAT